MSKPSRTVLRARELCIGLVWWPWLSQTARDVAIDKLHELRAITDRVCPIGLITELRTYPLPCAEGSFAKRVRYDAPAFKITASIKDVSNGRVDAEELRAELIKGLRKRSRNRPHLPIFVDEIEGQPDQMFR